MMIISPQNSFARIIKCLLLVLFESDLASRQRIYIYSHNRHAPIVAHQDRLVIWTDGELLWNYTSRYSPQNS